MGYGDLKTYNFGKFCDRDLVKVRLSELVDPNEVPWTCMCDNMSAVAIAKNAVMHKRSKHGHIAHQINRREYKAGHVVFSFIPTAENIADLLTKGLKRPTHQHLTNKIMSSMVDGELCTIFGEAMECPPNEVSRLANYDVIPLGLDPSRNDHMLPEHASLPTALPEGEVEQQLAAFTPAKATAALVIASPEKQAIQSVEEVLIKILAMLIQSIVTDLTRSSKKQANGACAIVDSGSSRTYVGAAQALINAMRCGGTVSVATGKVGRIVEEGELGPIKGAQKVNSFHRTLVSVMDLLEQFGWVIFDEHGVSILTPSKSGPNLMTRIGSRTASRLFDFDIDALSEHARQTTERGLTPTSERFLETSL